MSLPIPLPANALFTLTRELDSFTVDPLTGNEVPDKRQIQLKGCLTKVRNQGAIAQMTGANESSIFLEGFLLQSLPKGLSLDGTLSTVFDGAVGLFTVMPEATPFTNKVAMVTGGIPIAGMFTRVEGR